MPWKVRRRLARRDRIMQWLRNVAREAESLLFHSRDWIAQHIHTVLRQERPSAMPIGPTRDIRLDVDPTLEHRVDDAAGGESMEITVPLMEEDRLLALSPGVQDSPPIETYDVDSLLKPDISGCPVARRQLVGRGVLDCSIASRNRPDYHCAFLARKLGKTLGGGQWRKASKRRRNISGNTDPPGGHRPGNDGNPHERPCQKKLRLYRGGDGIGPRGCQNPRSDEHYRTGRMTTSDAMGLRLAKDVIRAPRSPHLGEWRILHLFLVSRWKQIVPSKEAREVSHCRFGPLKAPNGCS